MSLYRLFIASSIALTLTSQSYSSDENSREDPEERRGDRYHKKAKNQEVQAAQQAAVYDQVLVSEEDGEDKSTTRKRSRDSDSSSSLSEKKDGEIKKHQPDQTDTKVVPAPESFSGANQSEILVKTELDAVFPNPILNIIAKAGQGNPSDQYVLARIYWEGKVVAQDFAKAVEWFQKAAAQGHSDAQYGLGGAYWLGKGVARDFTEAVGWFRKAAEQGHANAQYQLGKTYRNAGWYVCRYDTGMLAQDFVKAVEWFQKAAAQGHANAQYELGLAYRKADLWGSRFAIEIEQDYAKAVDWFQKAAEQGHSDAQYELGLAYWDGMGVAKNLVETVKWFQKAAEQGHSDAQCNLGELYWKGEGVAQDLVETVKWFQKAAEQGHSDAQCNLGELYWKGEGVAQDLCRGFEFWWLTARNGDIDAIAEVEELMIFNKNAPMSSPTLSDQAQKFHKIILEITAHCQQKMITNNSESAFSEAPYAIGRLSSAYQSIFEVGDSLSPILLALINAKSGFMVSCVSARNDLHEACVRQNPSKLMILEDTITFDEDNVQLALQFQGYLRIMKQEFKKARSGMDDLIRLLDPPIATLHACQQAIVSAKNESKDINSTDPEGALHRLKSATERFNDEKADYDQIMAINKIEIDILKKFKLELDSVEQGMKVLLPSTIGDRNRQFIEDNSYLKP